MNVDITAIIHTHTHTQVEVTKFEDLEETHAEVRLKQTLWQSQKDWATDYESWLNVRCGNHNIMYCITYNVHVGTRRIMQGKCIHPKQPVIFKEKN